MSVLHQFWSQPIALALFLKLQCSRLTPDKSPGIFSKKLGELRELSAMTGGLEKAPMKGFVSSTLSTEAQGMHLITHLSNLYREGLFENTVATATCFLKDHPEHIEATHILGAAYLALGQYSDAQPYLEKCIRSAPSNSVYRKNMGDCFYKQNNPVQAIEHYLVACHVDSADEQAFFKLATCQSEYGQHIGAASPEADAMLQQAISNYLHVLELNKKNAFAWNNIACIYLYKNKTDEAEIATKNALKINPDMYEALTNLGIVSFKKNRITEAIKFTEQALSFQPDTPNALNNLSTFYGYTGDAYRATEASRRAVMLQPEISAWHDTFLLNQLYSDVYTDQERIAAYQTYQKAVEAALPNSAFRPHLNSPEPARRLKVAYVSGDFKKHSASYFTESLFALHDHVNFEVFLYYNNNQVDTITERYQEKYADSWRNIYGLTPEIIAELARDDDIDIMIDLAGHTKHNALAAFARKPAPVQATWLGFPETTGLRHMDYQLADYILEPEQHAKAKFGFERIWHLATPFCTYTPCVANPEWQHMEAYQASLLPATKNGYISFGSACNIIRLTPTTIRMWSGVLHAVPKSILILEAVGLDETNIADAILTRFANEGIERTRLRLCPRDGKAQYLLYHDFDIALDPFPSNGGTTTFDALWMGVPVISRQGDRFASRVGASILTHLGQKNWIAHDEDQFIDIAKRLASDIALLSAIRQGLRDKLASSALMDAPSFVRGFEQALRKMWHTWCNSEQSNVAKEFSAQNEALDLCATLLEQGALQEAAKGYQILLEKWPSCSKALYGLGMVLLLEADLKTAQKLLQRAVFASQMECQPPVVQAQILAVLGNVHARLKLFDEAITHLQHSLSLDYSATTAMWLNEITEQEQEYRGN